LHVHLDNAGARLLISKGLVLLVLTDETVGQLHNRVFYSCSWQILYSSLRSALKVVVIVLSSDTVSNLLIAH